MPFKRRAPSWCCLTALLCITCVLLGRLLVLAGKQSAASAASFVCPCHLSPVVNERREMRGCANKTCAHVFALISRSLPSPAAWPVTPDRKSTRLNSSHVK